MFFIFALILNLLTCLRRLALLTDSIAVARRSWCFELFIEEFIEDYVGHGSNAAITSPASLELFKERVFINFFEICLDTAGLEIKDLGLPTKMFEYLDLGLLSTLLTLPFGEKLGERLLIPLFDGELGRLIHSFIYS